MPPSSSKANNCVSVFPRKKSSDQTPFNGFKPKKGHRDPLKLCRSDVEGLFGLQQKEAAEGLGLSTTALKQVCRKLGIKRWPFGRRATKTHEIPVFQQADTHTYYSTLSTSTSPSLLCPVPIHPHTHTPPSPPLPTHTLIRRQKGSVRVTENTRASLPPQPKKNTHASYETCTSPPPASVLASTNAHARGRPPTVYRTFKTIQPLQVVSIRPPHHAQNQEIPEMLSDQPCSSSGLRDVCAREGAGWESHLHSVEDVVFEDVFEDVFAGGGGPPMHLGWTGAWGVTLEKMERGGGFCVGPQVSRMCASARMGGKGEQDTQLMERESERVRETGMGVWNRMLREFEGGRCVMEGAVGGETWERENKRVDERERFHTSFQYKSGSAEKRWWGGGDHDPLSISVPPPLLEVKENAQCHADAGGQESDCNDLSWLVGSGNV
mmetsp:Transcript_41091/g.34627  ORF Transcript_41091/g.34627 Transcript_41091/m.34627 type:complete len:436 (-) Transcript_41091:1029-2336(-)